MAKTGSCPNPLTYVTAKTNKPTLFYLTITSFLYTLSYLAALWRCPADLILAHTQKPNDIAPSPTMGEVTPAVMKTLTKFGEATSPAATRIWRQPSRPRPRLRGYSMASPRAFLTEDRSTRNENFKGHRPPWAAKRGRRRKPPCTAASMTPMAHVLGLSRAGSIRLTRPDFGTNPGFDQVTQPNLRI
ncbi:hypothetical protein NL676_013665 [Syzygium grande]|nr:hypothetical protein NL676_013665 [Syzygium grande]